jgi:hypothetical protein
MPLSQLFTGKALLRFNPGVDLVNSGANFPALFSKLDHCINGTNILLTYENRQLKK